MNPSLCGASSLAKVSPIILVLVMAGAAVAAMFSLPVRAAPVSALQAGDDSRDPEAMIGDPIAARYKVSMCVGCHGIPDYRTAFPQVYHVPRIGGQNDAYIRLALEDYKNGKRRYATMHAIAATLSHQDIADIAAYYAAQSASSADNPLK